MGKMMNKSYSNLLQYSSYEERLTYLMCFSTVGEDTFGGYRCVIESFYHSREWKDLRKHIIVRDNGCDLGIKGYEIPDSEPIYIHHINPLTLDDLKRGRWKEKFLNPENVISVSFETHQAIHYGKIATTTEPVERFKFDTCPWKRGG